MRYLWLALAVLAALIVIEVSVRCILLDLPHPKDHDEDYWD